LSFEPWCCKLPFFATSLGREDYTLHWAQIRKLQDLHMLVKFQLQVKSDTKTLIAYDSWILVSEIKMISRLLAWSDPLSVVNFCGLNCRPLWSSQLCTLAESDRMNDHNNADNGTMYSENSSQPSDNRCVTRCWQQTLQTRSWRGFRWFLTLTYRKHDWSTNNCFWLTAFNMPHRLYQHRLIWLCIKGSPSSDLLCFTLCAD